MENMLQQISASGHGPVNYDESQIEEETGEEFDEFGNQKNPAVSRSMAQPRTGGWQKSLVIEDYEDYGAEQSDQ